mgnify:CR=1 FL=1
MEKELIFNVSNEIQLISIIREIYESGYDITEYTVNKVENKTIFKLKKTLTIKDKRVRENKNEKRINTNS